MASFLDQLTTDKLKQQQLEGLASQIGTARENMVDPGILASRDAQINQANIFRQNLGNVRTDLQGQAGNNARVGLAQSIADNKGAANSRGLLYSGLRQAGEMGAQGQAASQLAQKNAGINQGLEGQAGQLDRSAVGAGINAAGAENSLADALAGRQQADQQQRAQMTSAIGGSIGGLAGSIAGGLTKKPKV